MHLGRRGPTERCTPAHGMLHSLDEQLRLQVAVEARGSQQEALHVLHV